MTEYIVNFHCFWIRNDRLITDRHARYAPIRYSFECIPQDIWMRYPTCTYYVEVTRGHAVYG